MGNLVLLAVVALFSVILLSVYNKLVRLRNLVKNAFTQIDVQLKRRYDLIPNLVEVAKRYMAHEKETLEAVIKARNTALTALQGQSSIGQSGATANSPLNSERMKNFTEAENLLSQNLNRLLVVAESYPELKANQNMMQLTEELTSTENKIAFARQAYNDSVMEYNNQREIFPNSIIAGFFNFQPFAGFEITKEHERETVKIAL